MRSKTIGRALGIGVRVAGKAILEDKPLSPEAARAAEQARLEAVRAAGVKGRVAGTALGQGTRNVRRGARNFGRAVWNPFAQATSVLWLEVTGMFFALFALFFAQHLYELRLAWRAGPEHTRFLLYAALLALFLYFSASSFLRASRKQRASQKQRG
jgi:hypothetical protein